ncbi:MAG: Nramp family divalent metal transporter [Gemmatimonadaceae bacterium]
MLRRLGPGLVTGAANDDPGAIGTHAQVGAQFGSSALWLAPWTIPLTAVVLEMCAQLGNVAGRGVITLVRFRYPRLVLWTVVGLFVVVNVVNLAADLSIMAESVAMLAGGPPRLWLLGIAVLSAASQLLLPYATYARALKLLALSLFAYVAAVFLIPQDWGAVLRASFVPVIRWDAAFFLGTVAVLGTRLSPYVIVWQPSQVVEEQIGEGKPRLQQRMGSSDSDVRAMQLDVFAGATVANLVTWAIMLTAATSLHARGITNVASATEAAEALRPVVGGAASAVFALGILSTGLLAVPVLAGGIGYALGEAFGWRRGLARSVGAARRFYGVIAAGIGVAALLGFLGVNPIRALVLSQVLNGIVAVPLVFLVLRLCNDREVMGEHVNGGLANVLGWSAVVVMGVAAAAAIWALATGAA